MGSAQLLTGPARRACAVERHGRFAVGTLSLMLVSVTVSLATWIVLPTLALQWSPTVILSGSMRPSIDVGDVVMLRPVEVADLGNRTVVLYDGGPGTGRIVHRIVQRQPDGTYVTQGDANPTPDSAAVRPDQVHGAAVLLVPWIGTPAAWMAEHRWPAVLAGFVAAVVCLRTARFAFDPAYDPWATSPRILPAAVLLSMPADDAGSPRPDQSNRLMDPALDQVVLARLAAQTAATHRRHSELMAP